MHTVAHVAFYISFAFAFACLLVAAILGCYLVLAKLVTTGAIGTTRRGAVVEIPAEDIAADWTGPAVIAAVGLFWTAIAFGLHRIN